MRTEQQEYFKKAMDSSGAVSDSPKNLEITKHSTPFLDSPELKQLIVDKTTDLTRRVHDGGYDHIVFLDKSARPLARLFRKIWDDIYAKETKPSIHFVNIGREHSLHGVDHQQESAKESASDKMNDAIFVRQVDELKSIFVNHLQGESLLIVDDVVNTGASLKLANELFQKAFPDLRIASTSVIPMKDLGQRDYLPWMKSAGATGVMEQSDTLLSSAITEDAIRKKIAFLEDRLQSEVKKLLNAEDVSTYENYWTSFSEDFNENITRKRFVKTIKKFLRNSEFNSMLEDDAGIFADLALLDKPLESKYQVDRSITAIIGILRARKALLTLKENIIDKETEEVRLSESMKKLVRFIDTVIYTLGLNLQGLRLQMWLIEQMIQEIEAYKNKGILQDRARRLREEIDNL